MAADQEKVYVRVERISDSAKAPWAIIVGVERYGNKSGGNLYPHFRVREGANRLAEHIAFAYEQEGHTVELTRAVYQRAKVGKVLKGRKVKA